MELRCKALLFDLDGVLVDSQAVVERTWRRWAERHQLDADAIIKAAHGRRTSDTLKEVVPHLAFEKEVAWLDAAELDDVEGLRIVSGAGELLAGLPPNRWAIVTSCGRALARRRLTSVGLPVPDVLVVSEDVKRGKPAPDAYRLAATRLGIDAADCVVFEDAPAGVAAAHAAGTRVIGLVTTYLAADLGDTETTIPDFTNLHVRADHNGFSLRKV